MSARPEAQAAAPLAFQPDESLETFSDMLARSIVGKAGKDWRTELWPTLAELGAFAALAPEERGGYGGAHTAAIACRVLAQAGIVSPFAISAATVARALAQIDRADERLGTIVRSLENGAAVATIALHEEDALPSLLDPQSVLVRDAGGYRLAARKRMVAFGAEADWVLVPVRSAAGGTAIALIERAKAMGALKPCTLIDGTPAADLELTEYPLREADVLATGEEARRLLLWMADAFAAAQCAESVGAMRALVNTTAEYLGTRKQFGQPLSANQALRHRFVDMEIMLAKAETMAAVAAAAVDAEDADDRSRIVATARYIVTRSAWKVSQEALQMHGAIGMANETPLGRYFKRLLALSLWFGDEDASLNAAFA